MITNERQYRITCTQLEKLRAAVETFDLKTTAERIKSAVLAKAELVALKSEYENLSFQIQEYETLKSGTIDVLKASSLEELPKILIKARIARRLSQRQLAKILGLKEQQIQRYEAEEYATANLPRLADVANALNLNISEVAEFRSALQEQPEDINKDMAWDEFPVTEMYQRNWFEGFSGTLPEAKANAEELVSFFVENSLKTPIRAAARQRIRIGGHVNHYALLAWQCRVISLAKKEGLKKKYSKKIITQNWLTNLAHISSEENGPKKTTTYLQRYGIRLIIVPHLSHTHLDGAAFLLPDGSPVIGITLRYDRLDNFWFVLFHELIHVMKHLHKGDVESIFDDLDADADDIEQETDNLAGEILVPGDKWEMALARYVRSEDSIKDFAKELEICPSIIAGKIRREADNYIILRDLVGQGKVRKLFPDIQFN